MKCLYILLSTCCLVSSGLAKPAAPALNYQDSFGQYSFGYSTPNSARSEFRTLNGVTHGAYSYIDDTGVIQSARYTADDKHGFQIKTTNAAGSPVLVQNTQEVIAVKKLHLGADEVDKTEKELEIQQKIGANNIFLKGLIPKLQGIAEGEGKTQIQINKDKVEENSKALVKETQTKSIQDDSIVIEGIPAQEGDEDGIKQGKDVDTVEVNAPTENYSESHKIIVPINILGLHPTYPTVIKYIPVSSLQYILVNTS